MGANWGSNPKNNSNKFNMFLPYYFLFGGKVGGKVEKICSTFPTWFVLRLFKFLNQIKYITRRKVETMKVKTDQEKEKINHIINLGINLDDDGRCEINNTNLKKLKPIPKGNRYREIILRDKRLMGFRARCNIGGSISFVYRYRPKELDLNGKPLEKLNITLGQWVDNSLPGNKYVKGMTPTVARQIAEDMKIKIAKKEDPYSILKAKKKGRSMISVFEEWISKRLDSANYKKKSQIDYKSRFNLYVKCGSKREDHKQLYKSNIDAFKSLREPIKDMTKNKYIAVHNAISKHSKYQANRVIEDLRLVEQYAIEIGVLEKRVCIFKEKELNKEVDRLDRSAPYTPLEMKRYKKAALKLIKIDRIKNLVSCFVLLAAAILGGRSKSMVYSLRWDQIDFKNKIIRFENTKNNEDITLDFDYRLGAILRILKGHRNTIHKKDKRYQYVFSSAKKEFKTKHIQDPRKTHRSIIEIAKLEYKCIHFLRHSWATNMYEATKDLLAVKEMGGWESLEAVKKYVDVNRKIRKQRLDAQRRYLANSHVA